MQIFVQFREITAQRGYLRRTKSLANLVYNYIDRKTNEIVCSDLKQSFFLKCGEQWQG